MMQIINLAKVHPFIRRWVFTDAMEDGEILMAMLKEADDLINLFNRRAGSRSNDWLVGFDDVVKERPICEGAASNLNNIQTLVFDHADRCIVEGRRHGEKALFADFSNQRIELSAREARFGEPLHIGHVHPALFRGMNEAIEIAILKLESKGEVRELPANFTELTDHMKAVIEIAHMVVGHLKNHQTVWDA